MSTITEIEWADRTWSPLLGCDKVSPGCDHCYAIRTVHRLAGNPHPKIGPLYVGLTARTDAGLDWTGTVRTVPERLSDPLSWRKPQRIFVNSQADLFHKDVPDEFIAKVWQVMSATPEHTYQILTKRHARMKSWVTRWYAGEIDEPYAAAPVDGYPGYFVTTRGEVLGKRADTRSGLKAEVGDQGHRRVTMYREGSPRSGDRELVHRLVLTAFARPARPGEQACHRNGDPSDNRLSNLYWGSQSANWTDRLLHGNGRSYQKVTEDQVTSIRARVASGESAYAVAKDYPISDTQVRNIVREKHWATPAPAPKVRPPARTVLPGVWLGVSVEDQHWADIRIPALIDTPAAVRWISAEPLLGPIHLPRLCACGCRRPIATAQQEARLNAGFLNADQAEADVETTLGLGWVVVGCESGPGARPMDLTWADRIVAQCQEAGVPVLVKQLPTGPRGRATQNIDTFPEPLRIREYPNWLAE